MKKQKQTTTVKSFSFRKKLAIGLASGILIIAFLLGIAIFLQQKTNIDIALDGEKISSDLFDKIMQQQVSDVVFEFNKMGLSSAGPEYWTTEVEGKTPAQSLAESTLQRLMSLKAMYDMAEDTGTSMENGINGIEKRLQTENQSRKDKRAQGQPVCGLSEFGFDTYLEYEMDRMEKQYCSNPQNPGMEITQQDHEKYYTENYETRFKQNDGIALSYLFINTNEMETEQAQKLKQQVQELENKIGAEVLLKDEIEQYSDLLEYFQHLDLEPAEVSAYVRSIGDVLDYAFDLEPGQNTSVIEENGVLYLIQCTNRTYNNYLTLDEVSDSINKTLREERYYQMVQENASKIQFSGEKQKVLDYVTYKMTQK